MKALQRLSALQHHDYRLYFGGQMISQCGTWMQIVGQSWLVLKLTDSEIMLGWITALQWLPTLLFSLVAGTIADRLPKRKLLVVTQSIQMLVAFTLSGLVMANIVQYWHVAIAATCLGMANAFDLPARQSFVVEMVGKEDLSNAIVLNSTMMNSARLIGPALAGALIDWKGVGPAFLCNGLSFLAVLAALLCMQAEGLPKVLTKRSVAHDLVNGLRYVGRTPAILMMLLLMLIVGLFVFNFNVTIPLLATRMLGQNAKGYGALMSAMGAGALVCALTLSLQGRRKPQLSFVIGAGLVFSTIYLVVGTLHSMTLAISLMAILGIFQIFFTSQLNTLVQMTVTDEMRGRVMSMYTLAFGGTTPFGAVIMGYVTEHLGAPWGFFLGGGASILGVLLLVTWWVMRSRTQANVPQTGTV